MRKILAFYEKIKPYLNKYLIVLVLFGVLIVFIDEHNLIRRMQYDRKIRALRKEIRQYEKERDHALEQLEDLRTGSEELEKIARERYLMKKENEEIFLLE
ncbi:MAG: septum formation initiator family protein [Bacteroidales bacterium]|jgi:cell division protein FtsB|nr:septum formation initiator family protein [Bacteroidales bacterium]MDD2617717.1 septum formation initiator family protein [Bacteroidales bacterium]MDD4639746.1 septum formation initiator family protein [Bacteroidales bacterium]NLB02565.1 septum formation initiator family protein [Bacteroidales bacterium]